MSPAASRGVARGFEDAVALNVQGKPTVDMAAVHQSVEALAAAHPDRVAVTASGSSITYSELNRRANRLARHLIERGVGADDRVALVMDRTFDLISALLAVHKAGAGYVPIDPTYPRERVRMLFEESGARCVLAPADLARRFEDVIPPGRLVEIERDPVTNADDAENPNRAVAPDDLAYVMFTSGSTGRPKGVMIEHRSLTSFVASVGETLNVTPDDRVFAVITICFDLSVFDIFFPLAHGLHLHLASEEEAADPRLLSSAIDAAAPTLMLATPATWRMLVLAGWSGAPGLRGLSCGEALPRNLVDDLLDRGIEVWNAYGPTEATIFTTLGRISRNGPVDLGPVLDFASMVILNDAQQLVETGEIGELYLGGACVARGYLNQPELTAEKFVEIPGHDGRWFRVGDLCRFEPEYGFLLHGRVDQQIKVHGFRIEPAEIESALELIDGVNQAVVVAAGTDVDRRLVAYVTASDGTANLPDAHDLRAVLRGQLPAHLVPTTIITLDAMPMTLNQKIDRARLPSPDGDRSSSVYGTESGYPRDATLTDLFREQVRAAPNAPAIIDGQRVIDYATLDEWSDRLAAQILRRDLPGSARIAIHLRRSPEFVVGVLAALKAGASYVPLDPDSPALWRRQLVEITESALILAHGERDTFDAPPEVPVLDVASSRAADGATPELPDVVCHANDEAYVMFTSGSTGVPKGVAVPHRAVVRLVLGQDYLPFDEQSVFLLHSNPAFDASTLEIWGPLLNGGRLAIAPASDLDLLALGACIQASGVTCLWLTAALFNTLVDDMPAVLRGVKWLVTGGEALSVPHVCAALNRLDGTTLVNGYGPTEATTFACTWRIPRTLSGDAASVPIGQPIANTHVHFLDERQQGVARGDAGELWIGGDGVAIGYLNDPALTADRFRADPFGREPGARMYRTGDRGRLREDGTIEFIGRVDRQVKIRGQRVEPGEVEAALHRLESIGQTAVEVEGQGDARRLVAYVTPGTTMPTGHGLREALEETLPRHLVPTTFVVLESLPRNANGKIDRSRLSTLAGDRAPAASCEPRSQTERQLAAIWCEVLARPKVGVDDDFFNLGGHSLSAAVMLARVTEQLGRSAPLSTLFACPTIETLAGHLDAKTADSEAGPAPMAPRDEELALSFAQQRLWFLENVAKTNGTYNVPFAMRVRGHVDLDRLRDSMLVVIQRHEALRTSVPEVDHVPHQQIHPARLPWQVVEVENEDDSRFTRRLRDDALRPFDLAEGPLVRASIYVRGADDHTVLLTLHHLIVDLWSARLLFDEIGAAYASPGAPGSALSSPPERHLADFAYAQRGRSTPDALEPKLQYWQQKLNGAPTTPPLPADHERPARMSFRGAVHSFVIDRELADAVARLSRARGQTPFAAWLGAAAWEIADLAGRDSVLIGTHVSQRRTQDEQAMAGFFLNTLPIRVDVSPGQCFIDLQDQVHETVVAALANADAPLETIIERVQPARDWSFSPLFQIEFVWTDETDHPTLALPGCSSTAIDAETGTSRFDLTIELRRTEQGLVGRLIYAADLFAAATIELLAAQIERRVAAVVHDPEAAMRIAGQTAAPAATAMPSRARPTKREPRTEVESGLVAIWHDILSVNDIGVDDDFFDLGGHSMRAVVMLGQVENAFDVALPMATLQRAPTVSALAAVVETARREMRGETALPRVDRAQRLPLSFAQYGMWFLETTGEVRGAYNEAFTARLDGPIDHECLQRALSELQARHEVLRTVFEEDDDGQPFVVIREAAEVSWRTIDCSGAPADETTVAEYLRDDAREAFDLRRGPLWRALLLERGADDHVLQLTFHHAIIDDWSARLLLQELSRLCAPGSTSDDGPDDSDRAQYVDWAAWQRNAMNGPPGEPHLAFWETYLRGAPDRPALPTDHRRPDVFSHRGDVRVHEVGAATTSRLDELSRSRHETLFTTLLAATGAVLARQSGQAEITVGTPVSQRHHAAEQQMAGMFLNMLPVRIRCGEETTFSGLVDQVHHDFSSAVLHQEVPFEQVVDRVRPSRSRSYAPLYQVVFVWLEEEPPALALPGCVVAAQPVHTGSAKYDLTVEMRRNGDGITLRLEYATDLFDAATIDAIGDELVQMLDRVSVAPQHALFLPADARETGGPAPVNVTAGEFEARESSGRSDNVPDELECRLLELWQAVLEKPDAGVDDDFFDLGGHSLAAARLAARASRDLGLRLPVNLLFKASTVRMLAAELRGPRVNDAFTAIAVQPRGSQPPLFYIPGLGGSAFVLPDLSRDLGDDQPIYALQAHSVGKAMTVEEYSAACVECIKGVCPAGPYRLIGFSLGGTYAFEAACQLTAAGAVVDLLMVIDHFPSGTRWTPASIWPGLRNVPVWIAEVWQDPSKRIRGTVRQGFRRALKLLGGRKAPLRAEDYIGDGVWSAEMLAVADAHFAAYRAYRPQVYPGRLTLVRARRQPILAPVGRKHGWAPLARGGVVAHTINGGHMDMLERDGASCLARCMREALANLDDAAPERG